MSKDLIKKVYDHSNNGLDIIFDVCPQAVDAVTNKRKFRLRSEEHTPSACVYPPKDANDCWHVKDFGMGEGEGYFSPIDLYMWDRDYTQAQFAIAVQELAEQYGVQEELKQSVNKPDVVTRAAMPCELGKPERVTYGGDFTTADLNVWGPCVKPEHLVALQWHTVAAITRTVDGTTTIKKPTATYPIYAQECMYQDAQGNMQKFIKVYEPKNCNKSFRFHIIDSKPQHYIFGLSALCRKYEERGEEKLDEVVIVSGGSDAVICLSMGYQPIWLGSETETLQDADMKLLLKYAKRVVNIPDIDATGIKVGRRLALRMPSIYTAWMTTSDMHLLHDNRGRYRKDLKDYIQLNPNKKAMRLLINRALCAQFWTEHTTKQGDTEYGLSRTSLDYFLELNGFYTLKDDSHIEPIYIRIDGILVRRVTAKAIVAFLKQWMKQHGMPSALQDKVLRSHDLPTNNVSTLHERNDLDFRKGTATSQYFHFRNCWVEVTADKITTHRYTDAASHYVWEDNVIQHDYRTVADLFSITTDTDGRYKVSITDAKAQSNLLKFLVNSSRLYWRKTDESGLTLTPDEEADEQLCLASRLANLGYLLTSYKSESEAWATICLDSTMAESVDECNGRSGKSFYISAVAKMAHTFTIDAGTTSFKDSRFIFDGVTTDTDLVFLDECPRKFNYNFVYGRVTGDFRVEEKNKHSYVIPFTQSPKFVMATNYTLSRHDPSTEGRIWPQPFSDYYHVKSQLNDYRESRSIRDDFGQNLMGAEYSENEWQLDLAFMLQCVRFYLSLPVGSRKIMPPLSRIERREQMAAVGKDFKQWADEYFAEDSDNLDCELKAEKVLADFNQETKYGWSLKMMTQHLSTYCQLVNHLYCLNPASVTKKQTDGMRWVKRDDSGAQKTYYYVMSTKAAEQAIMSEPQQQNLEFGTQTDDEVVIF